MWASGERGGKEKEDEDNAEGREEASQEPARRREIHTPPRSNSIIPPHNGGELLFKWGRVKPTRCPRFVSNGGGMHATSPPVSFRFKRGQRESHTLPPFLFFSNGGGVYATRRPPFLSVSNGGSTRCPLFFPFPTGAACNQHAAAVSFVYHPPITGGYLLVYPPIMGGLFFFASIILY
jgi:hypothetical protein